MNARILALVIFTINLTSLCSMAKAQRDFSDVTIKTHHVAGNIYMLEGSGGNIGVSAGSDGLLMIDDQFAPLSAKIQAALDKLDKGKLKFLLNTHWHGDHTGGNETFGEHATIIAQSNVRKRLATKQMLFGREVGPLSKQALPVITFDDSLSVYFNGEEIKAFHLPHGHTDGDSVILFTKSHVVHMGDLMFAGMFPFVDLDHGGNVLGVARNVATIIKTLPLDVKIIPGHGPISTLDDLKAFHAMLIGTIDVVRKQVKAGKSLEDIVAAGLPAVWDKWADGFIKTDKWLEAIYKSLQQPS